MSACPVCGAELAPRLRPWLRRCPECRLWAAVASAEEMVPSADSLAEDQRPEAFEALRRSNFDTILDHLAAECDLAGARLLEVGPAEGWFLAQARERGARPVAIEPDAPLAARLASQGFDVRVGRFPEDLAPDARFDAVVFNDVFEHLPDPSKALARCFEALAPGGRLVLNLPDSRGFFFRTACLLARLGIDGPLRRMWQLGFRSPHLFYFDAENLTRLANARGFELRARRALPSLRLRGLWTRLAGDPNVPRLAALATWSALVALHPLLVRAAPPDILLAIYRRRAR